MTSSAQLRQLEFNPMPENSEALPPELQSKLKEPLPAAAIKPHPTKDNLSSIQPAFVIERMNDVFGIGGYREVYREVSVNLKEKTWNKGKQNERTVSLTVATVHGTLTIPKYGIHLENFGGCEQEDPGDALKGACTDAFTKMCSHLGIGLDVYKGKHDTPKPPDRKPVNNAQGKQPPPDVPKITIQAVVTETRKDTDTFFAKVGERLCATKQPEIIQKLADVKGKTVELLVSEVKTPKGVVFQIHKVISSWWEKGGQR